MTSTPETPNTDAPDLTALREEIDELKAIPEDELLSPLPKTVEEEVPTAHSTDAIGSEKWDEPVEDESLDQE